MINKLTIGSSYKLSEVKEISNIFDLIFKYMCHIFLLISSSREIKIV